MTTLTSSSLTNKAKKCPSAFIMAEDGITCQHLLVEQACYLGKSGPSGMKACYGADGKPIAVPVDPKGTHATAGAGAGAGSGTKHDLAGVTGDLTQQELMEEQHTTILKNIKELEDYERSLFSSLQQSRSNPQQSAKISSQINQLGQMRTRLFNELRNAYGISHQVLSRDRQDLADQMAMIGIVDNQLSNVNAELADLDKSRDDKLRMVEVANYEYSRYYAHKTIFKVAAFCALGVFVERLGSENGILFYW